MGKAVESMSPCFEGNMMFCDTHFSCEELESCCEVEIVNLK